MTADARITGHRHWLVRMPFDEMTEGATNRRAAATRLVVRLETDAGIVGWGETICLLDSIEPVLAKVVLPIARGMSVSEAEKLHRHVLGAGYYHHKRAAVMAIAAVELAMWDAFGQLCGQPLCRLWGGQWRETIPIAAYLLVHDPGRLAEKAAWYKAKGFRDYKVKIGTGAARDVAQLRAARKVLGDEAHIRADCNGAWSRATARRQFEKLREFDLAYIEQPLEMDDLEGHAELRRSQPIPIALDESVYTAGDLANVVRAGAADIVLLDAHEAGGFFQARKQAAIAEAFGLTVTLHAGCELGLSQVANLHLAASIPELRLSIDSHYPLFSDDILPEPLVIADGCMRVPDKPGLGVEPDLDKLERYRTDAVRDAYLDPARPGWFPMKPSY
jgi:glucarate dehydratase